MGNTSKINAEFNTYKKGYAIKHIPKQSFKKIQILVLVQIKINTKSFH